MGTVSQEPPPLIQDLKVTVHDTSLVFPSEHIPNKPFFMSNIDKVLNFDVQTIHFFPVHVEFPPDKVAERLKAALAEILVHYEFLSGRLKFNAASGRLEIECNSEGVGFVVASSECSLDDVGDLVYPNPAFERLVTKSLDILQPDNQPLCIVQVTSFTCGGFAMGVSTNHATFDGLSFKMFLQNLGALAADKPLVVDPCNDRRLLAARSPPLVSFPHPELLKLDVPKGQDSSRPLVFKDAPEDLDFKIFKLSPEDIARLKEKAAKDAAGGGLESSYPKARITSFNVVTAHIWRCKALSSCADADDGSSKSRASTLLYAVDIRPRLEPPLPQGYAGNAVLTAYVTATCGELEEWPLGRLVEMVTEGAGRMTDEYARSAIDWGEVNVGFPHGEVLVSSWWRLGFADVEYPWGRPRYSCPLVYHRKDIILLFPDMITTSQNSGDGVNVLVALPAPEMAKFQSLFHKFLA
ncbi:acyltransferase GLAUCE [Syzygium oleosum]|uniref:acyltransferase GLAUCE n=1 Tax=Syzygium oleosum TaxID=219896 RepID=UPI0011D230BF|nr:acyltransferase GLAUCE [Syzygium oleosum]